MMLLLLLFPGFVRIREVTCIVIIQNHELITEFMHSDDKIDLLALYE